MKIKARMSLSVIFLATLFIFACATKEKPAPEKEVKESPAEEKKEASPASVEVSGNRTTFMNSVMNNSLTLHTVNRAKAEKIYVSLEGQSKNKADEKDIEGLLSAARLAGQDVNQLMAIAQRLALLEMKKNVEHDVSDEVKLELAIGAIKHSKFSLAEFYLEDLVKVKSDKIRAGAYNAYGVMALLEQRIPEAVDFWKQALKADGSYKPARFNLGFTALKYADAKTAKSALDGLQDDPFGISGLLVVERLLGNPSATAALCKKILDSEPNYKPAIYNCAVHEFQSNNDFAKAKELIQRLAKVKSEGGSVVDEKGFKFSETMEKAKAQQKVEEPKPKDAGAAKKKPEEENASQKGAEKKGAEGDGKK